MHTDMKPMVQALLLFLLCAAALGQAPGELRAAEESYTGRLVAKFVDYDPDSGIPAVVQHLLVDETGSSIQIRLDDTQLLAPYGGIRALLGQSITVRAQREGDLLVVSKLDTSLDPAKRFPQPISGSLPQVTLLLRYADDSSTPQPKSYFEFMYTSSSFPGTNHYIKEASYNIANLDGSQVFGWYDLPEGYGYYNWDKNGNGDPEFDLSRALPHAVAVADAEVFFPSYMTVNFVMNGQIECDPGTSCAWSKTSVLISADVGVPVSYGFTIMGLWGHDRMAVVPHETLHTWGLHHSGSYDGMPYDSNWDVMSGQGVGPWHPTYGHLTVYGISYHMLGMGWIPPERNFDRGESTAGVIKIEHLEFPPLVPGTFAMAKPRILGLADYFYTVEYRTLDGWDAGGPIPGRAVLLHRVDALASDQNARVVDVDGDGDPNDEAAMWRPGETYHHLSDQVIVHVEGWDLTTATVSVSNRALNTVYVSLGAPGPGYGTAANPWDSASEGYASAYRGGTVYITPGAYNESFRMSKPCTLIRAGSSGVVRIGN